MKINEVIERHGMQLRDVSREMGMKPSALQSAIDRNLTVKTLRQISEAARIPIAEFFFDELKSDPHWVERIADELPAGFTLTSSGTEEAPKTEASAPQTATAQADVLPFKDEPVLTHDLTADIAFICPHCHEAIKLGFVK